MNQKGRRLRFLTYSFFSFIILSFSFQNCGKSGFDTKNFVTSPTGNLDSASTNPTDSNSPTGPQPSPTPTAPTPAMPNPTPTTPTPAMPNPTPTTPTPTTPTPMPTMPAPTPTTPAPTPTQPPPAPQPSPVPTSNLAPNMPQGLKQILHHDFTTREGDGCNAYYPGGSLLLSDPNEPSSPSGFMRNIKYAGASEGGTMVDCVHPLKGEIYYAFTWRPSSPFGGYDNGANKMVFYISAISNSSGGAWGSHFYGKTNGQRVVDFFLQGGGVNNCHVDNISGDCADSTSMVFLPNVDTSPVLEGKWHRIEVYFKRSTNGSSKDGVTKMWIDGSLRINHSNVNTPQYDWTSIMTNHTWDGQCAKRNASLPPTTFPNDCRPYDDYHDFGDFFVGAK